MPPLTTFKKYPQTNDAYGEARKAIIAKVNSWNRTNPYGACVGAFDVPVMLFVHSCIPDELAPPELGSSTKNLQERMRVILYPFIESGKLSDRWFASQFADFSRIDPFLEKWLSTKTGTRPRGKQPRLGLYDFVKEKLIHQDAILHLRTKGKEFFGTITATGGVRIDVGEGLRKFKSPNEVISKGLGESSSPWLTFFVKDSTGVEVSLGEIKARYLASCH